MLIPNHPADERLAAWADLDDDARTDAALLDHVPTCARCTEFVDELGALRAALADLPDVAPPRPLRILPPVAEAPAAGGAGASGWVRRLFAPMMTAGAALALVGVVGTAMPVLQGAGAGVFANVSSDLEAAQEADASAGAAAEETLGLAASPRAAGGEAAAPSGVTPDSGTDTTSGTTDPSQPTTLGGGDDGAADRIAATEPDRPIFPMLLFTGVALIIGALMLRWILAPRAG